MSPHYDAINDQFSVQIYYKWFSKSNISTYLFLDVNTIVIKLQI